MNNQLSRMRFTEEDVLHALEKHLLGSGVEKKSIKKNFVWEKNGKMLLFDLAVLRPGQRNQIYIIKSSSAIKSNANAIKNGMKNIAEDTRADVYLACFSQKNKLTILSADENWNLNSKRKTSIFAKNVSDYFAKIKELCDLHSNEPKYFFRGHSDKDYVSIPSIFRKGMVHHEQRLYRESIRKMPCEFTKDMSTFDKLVKMQHYGLPTRLLDITSNPLVALYFACKEKKETDGCVMIYPVLDNQIKYYDSESVCILSNLAKCSQNFCFLNEKGRFVFDIQEDKPNFKEELLKEDALKKVLCVVPKMNNNRIIRQQGAFFIFGMGKTKNDPARFLDSAIKIYIKAKYKEEILKELAVLGFDEGSLFPEVDKVLEQIKSTYK